MFSSILPVLALSTAVLAKTVTIEVGNGGIIFSPDSTTADVGDSIEFMFYSGSGPHSVVTSSFDTPCSPAPTENLYFSGYLMGTDSGNETYTMPVTSTDPIWYYCSARKHCEGGMVGVINPPSDNNIDAYASGAQAATSNVAPGSTQIQGTVTTLPASTVTRMSMTSATTHSMMSSMSDITSSMSGMSSSVGPATTSSSSVSSETSSGGGARQTLMAGLMAAGGLAALIV